MKSVSLAKNSMGNTNDLFEQIDTLRKKQKKVLEKQEDDTDHRLATTPAKVEVSVSENCGIMPSAFNLSSLFVPISKKQARKDLKDKDLIHLWTTCRLTYSGEQLDESDRDVMIALLHIAVQHTLGVPFAFTRHQILRMIRPTAKSFGSTDYAWLHDSIRRIRRGIITYEQHYRSGKKMRLGFWCDFNLITMINWADEKHGVMCCTIDPRIAQLFEDSQYAIFSLQRRFRLKMALSKSLEQLLNASKERRQTYTLPWLMQKHDYHSEPKKVKFNLTKACEDLRNVGIIESYSWTKNESGEWCLTFCKADPSCFTLEL